TVEARLPELRLQRDVGDGAVAEHPATVIARACRGTLDDQPTMPGARKCAECTLYLAGITHVDWAYLYAKCWRGGLDSSKHSNSGGYGRVSNDRCSRDAR